MTLLNLLKRKKEESIGVGLSFVTPGIEKYIKETGGQKLQTYDLGKKGDELIAYRDVGVLKVEILAKDCCKKMQGV